MRTIVPVVAGPFPTHEDAFKWAVRNWWNGGVFPAAKNMRRTKRGWVILARNLDTHHVGSKAWRKRARRLVAEFERGME